MSTVTDLVGYVLETLRLDSEYTLYRGRHAGGAAPILVLAPAAAQQSSANLGRLEHEYALAGQLDPEWAVQPSALARRDGHTMLVFEDPGGEPLDRLLSGPLKISEFLRIAIALAGALAAGPTLLRGGIANLQLAMPPALTASAAAIVGAMIGLILPDRIVQLC